MQHHAIWQAWLKSGMANPMLTLTVVIFCTGSVIIKVFLFKAKVPAALKNKKIQLQVEGEVLGTQRTCKNICMLYLKQSQSHCFRPKVTTVYHWNATLALAAP